MSRLWFATAALLLLGCSEAPTPHSRPKESPRVEPSPNAEAPTPPKPNAASKPSSTPKGPGPLPQSDQEIGRRAAVYALLAGGDMAKNLPEQSADEGKTFDPNLAEAMAPTPGGPVPKVRITDSSAEGGLAKEVVRRVLRARMSEIRFCYIKRIRSESDEAGTLELQVSIGEKGGVSALSVEGDGVDESVAKCVEDRGKRWKFPADPTPTTAEFTISLTPK